MRGRTECGERNRALALVSVPCMQRASHERGLKPPLASRGRARVHEASRVRGVYHAAVRKGQRRGAGLLPSRAPSLRVVAGRKYPGRAPRKCFPSAYWQVQCTARGCATRRQTYGRRSRQRGRRAPQRGGCNGTQCGGAPCATVLAMVLQRSSRMGAAAVVSSHLRPTRGRGRTPWRIVSKVALPRRKAARLRDLYVWGGLGLWAPPCGC